MIKFGTDGWRAVLEKEFTEANVERVTLAIGKYVYETFGLDKVILVGYDPRNKAEDYAKQTEYREQFDLCVSRAVANLSTLSEYCLPYVRVGGMFIPYKSGEIDDEVQQAENAIRILGGKLDEVIKFQLPSTEVNRSFVKVNKN